MDAKEGIHARLFALPHSHSPTLVVLLLLGSLVGEVQGQLPDPSACSTFTCPTGYQLKEDADNILCAAYLCEVGPDRDTCCDERCSAGLRCPMHYFEKSNYSELLCVADCDMDEDLDTCCDQASTCSNFTCPDNFAPKPSASLEYCSDAVCDEELDVDRCCDQACQDFVCPDDSTLQAIYQNGSDVMCVGKCHAALDIKTCCSFSPRLNSSSQLLRAAVLGLELQVERLVSMGVPVPSTETGFQMQHMSYSTALHAAALQGNVAIATSLIKGGHSVNSQDVAGWTALHLAAGRGHVDFVQNLLELNADPLIKNAKGLMAREVTDVTTVQALLAESERNWTEAGIQDAALHADPLLLQALPFANGLEAWFAADTAGDFELAEENGAVSRWLDRTGRGNDLLPLEDGGQSPYRRNSTALGSLPLASVYFAAGEVLVGAGTTPCKTVAFVIQFVDVGWFTSVILAELDGAVELRLSDPVRGFWRNRPLAGRTLTKRDWQYGQADRVWLNGDNYVQTWPSFPNGPVAIIAEKRTGVADGDDFVLRLGDRDRGMDALVGEVLVFNRQLSDDEVQQLNNYLVTKWSIPLVS